MPTDNLTAEQYRAIRAAVERFWHMGHEGQAYLDPGDLDEIGSYREIIEIVSLVLFENGYETISTAVNQAMIRIEKRILKMNILDTIIDLQAAKTLKEIHEALLKWLLIGSNHPSVGDAMEQALLRVERLENKNVD